MVEANYYFIHQTIFCRRDIIFNIFSLKQNENVNSTTDLGTLSFMFEGRLKLSFIGLMFKGKSILSWNYKLDTY